MSGASCNLGQQACEARWQRLPLKGNRMSLLIMAVDAQKYRLRTPAWPGTNVLSQVARPLTLGNP